MPGLDVGAFVVGNTMQTAHLLGKSEGVLAGVQFAQATFDHLGLDVVWLKVCRKNNWGLFYSPS